MTDNVTSQNIDLSTWETLYMDACPIFVVYSSEYRLLQAETPEVNLVNTHYIQLSTDKPEVQ
jgi:hypothetical protein